MRFLSGELPRILRSMKGLQQLKLTLADHWGYGVPYPKGIKKPDAIFGRFFLRIVQRELGHVKEITVGYEDTEGGDGDVGARMASEMWKGNEGWSAKGLGYSHKRIPRTNSPLQYLG